MTELFCTPIVVVVIWIYTRVKIHITNNQKKSTFLYVNLKRKILNVKQSNDSMNLYYHYCKRPLPSKEGNETKRKKIA